MEGIGEPEVEDVVIGFVYNVIIGTMLYKPSHTMSSLEPRERQPIPR